MSVDLPTIAITGTGVSTAAGCTTDGLWASVLAGRSAAAPVRAFDAAGAPFGMACEVADDELAIDDRIGSKVARRLDRVAQIGVAAGLDAVTEASLAGVSPERCAVVAGTGMGGLGTVFDQTMVMTSSGRRRVSPFTVPLAMPNALAATLSLLLGWTGPSMSTSVACASGAAAIAEAARLLALGEADVVVAGGAESLVNDFTMTAFWRAGALSERIDDPTAASRPFDADRDGFVLGEGAGFLVLERLDHAMARGARPLGLLLGHASTNDAHNLTAPCPDGAGAAAAVEQAITRSRLVPSDIRSLNAHGTSTPVGDVIEAKAFGKVFGGGVPPVTATKGVTGHLLGGSGAVEAVVALRSATTGLVPPTANHERTDPAVTAAGVDVVAGAAVDTGPGPVVTTSFAFGGHNTALVIGPMGSAR
jgi:3-oxoacyl-[acyl-carrier-protein] synthase II